MTLGSPAVVALFMLIIGGDVDCRAGEVIEAGSAQRQAELLIGRAVARYHQTPPLARISWGGLVVCAAMGLGVCVERMYRVRKPRIVPAEFVARFLGRLREGKLDRLKALDHCEMNSSPAARVALAAVKRWGRPTADMERAVALAGRIEVDKLTRNLGTLRRLAVVSPLLGVFGTIATAARLLERSGPALAGVPWGPALASALTPSLAGLALAILALAVYDGLVARIESVAGSLYRLGAETVDGIELAVSGDGRAAARTPHQARHDIREPSESRGNRA